MREEKKKDRESQKNSKFAMRLCFVEMSDAMMSHQHGLKHGLNKDTNNRHVKVDTEKTMGPKPHTKNYRQNKEVLRVGGEGHTDCLFNTACSTLKMCTCE